MDRKTTQNITPFKRVKSKKLLDNNNRKSLCVKLLANVFDFFSKARAISIPAEKVTSCQSVNPKLHVDGIAKIAITVKFCLVSQYLLQK